MTPRGRNLLAELRYAFRQLLAAPRHSAFVVGVLALGIGASLATFMLVDAVLFRPLGIAGQERVVRIGSGREYVSSSSYPGYLEYRDRADAFTGVAAERGGALHWRLPDGGRERVGITLVSGNWFEVLGLEAVIGRGILPEDDRAGAERVAVVSERFWRDRLGGRQGVLGEMLRLDEWDVAIVGVMPDEFRGLRLGSGPQVWMPLASGARGADELTEWNWHSFDVIARLAPGIDPAQADAQVDAIAMARGARLDEGDRELHAMAVPAFPLTYGWFGQRAGDAAWLLLGGGFLILLAAAANAAGLLLVRGERRRSELAVRASLGATAARLTRLLLLETLVLCTLAAACGTWLARLLAGIALDIGAADSVLAVQADALPEPTRSAAIAVALALIACVAAGAFPALRPRRMALVEELKVGGAALGTASRWRSGRVLVAGQFALTVVLLIAAGLMGRTLLNLWLSPLGVGATEALVMDLDYATEHRNSASGDRLNAIVLEALAGAPGVEAAALAAMVPVADNSMESSVALPERSDGGSGNIQATYNPVSPGYFAALRVQLLRGRDFTAADGPDSARVAIVSEALARRFFPGGDALGRQVDFGPDSGVGPAQIVGVVADAKYMEVVEPPRDVIYVPVLQRFFGGWHQLVVRPQPGQEQAALASMRRAWMLAEPERAMPIPSTIAQRAAGTIATPRFLATTLIGFGLLALGLAGAGIYGAFSFLVAMRQRELGLRLAIGARAGQVFRLVLRDGLRTLMIGTAAGVLLAAALGGILAGQLTGVTPHDPLVFCAVAVLSALVGLIATAMPARAASRIDPQRSLRSE